MASKIKALAQKGKGGAPEEDPETPPDSPLLDLSGAAVRKMIKQAKNRGYVTYEEFNSVVVSEEVASEQIEDILAMVNEMGINVIETEEAEPDEEEQREEPEEEEESEGGEIVEVKHPALAKVEKSEPSAGLIHIRRLKNGSPSTQPLSGRELRALRRLRRESNPGSPWVFLTERKGPFTTDAFAKMLAKAGGVAGLEVKVHPHMLRHACGYALAEKNVHMRTIQGLLGHKSIQHTSRYVELAPGRYAGIWKD